MKYLYLLILFLIPQAAMSYSTAVPWFTDASLGDSIKGTKPVNALPAAPGSYGDGVQLTQSLGLDNSVLQQQQGAIAFWIKPNWNGNDGQNHKLLRIGNPATEGLLVEKSAQNTLRYVMAGSGKVAVSRVDVSGWQAGEWHHIYVGWFSLGSNPVGMPLWIDKVCVEGSIFPGSSFMNVSGMADKKVYIGDASSNAIMDELIFRNNNASTDNVYQDYFRTAPFTAIQINPDANLVRSDSRVVNGSAKQFGLKALMEGKWVDITCFDVRAEYGCWSYFDAKPYITWSTDNSTIATVNSSGKVTGKAVGSCTLTASFRGMSATYNVNVISVNQPDIDLMYVERIPRYVFTGTKWWPAEGEAVQSIAHVGNFGYTTLPAGTVVKFELIPDANSNFQVDADELPTVTQTQTINQALAPRDTTTVTFSWNWTQSPVFVRVTVDPDSTVSEICEANNQRCELNVARAFHWGYRSQLLSDNYNNKVINLVGSFSNYDWSNATVDRVNVMLRESKYPGITPDGIHDAIRVDNFQQWLDLANRPDENWEKDKEFYDGGYPFMEPDKSTPMDMDPAICHEIGHTTLSLPDLYGYGTMVDNIYLKDPNGQLYARTGVLPAVTDYGLAIVSHGEGSVTCGGGYVPLMVWCHMWLLPEEAGTIQHYTQYRPQHFWGVQGDFVPSSNVLRVCDVNDQPLKGAAVYVYHVVTNYWSDASSKYFVDRPKFLGNTNDSGEWTFPKVTDVEWDDANTDTMDGSINIANPFGTATTATAFTPNTGTTEGVLLLKIVSGDQVEFRMMTLSEFNEAYFRNSSLGYYNIRTSLKPSVGTTPILRPALPDAIKQFNGKPVVVVPAEIVAIKGQQFTIDALGSYDPEGQPITLHWRRTSGSASPDSGTGLTFTGIAPNDYSTSEYQVYAFDGLRLSNPTTVKITVVSATTIAGKVTDAAGNAVVGAAVGVKKSAYASADPIMYLTTDAAGNYGPQYFQPGTYYVAAWKDGWLPTDDTIVAIKENMANTVNLQLTMNTPATISLGAANVAASNSGNGLVPARAVDGDLTTAWETYWWSPSPVYYYIDFGKATDISGIALYRYFRDAGSYDDYTIDTMTSGNPLDPASWTNNSAVKTVYSATQTLHGYPIQPNLVVDPFKMCLTSIRGIRFTFNNRGSLPTYDFREIKIYSSFGMDKISDLKNIAVGTIIQVHNKQVSGVPAGGIPNKTYYIGEPGRACGIRVYGNSVTNVDAGLGDTIDVGGTVKLTTSGERYIAASSIVRKADTRPIAAVGMTSNPANNPLNQGLYVKIWGKVKTTGSNYFTVSDGGAKPMKVICGTLIKPSVNQYVRVRGVLSADTSGATLLMQNQVDWTPLTATYQPLPIPGMVGSTRDYLLCGLFRDTTPGVNLMDIDFISRATGGSLTESTVRPESGDMAGTSEWFRYDGLTEVVDLNRAFGSSANCVAYAYIEIYSPTSQTVDIPVGGDDGIALWVNGAQVYRQDALANNIYGADCIRNVQLNAGLNSVLIKVRQQTGTFGFVTQFANTGTYTGQGWGKSTPKSGLGYVIGHQ